MSKAIVTTRDAGRSFPLTAGILLGLGLGGFFDGIVFHQLLQWHHMVTSAGYPADSLSNLQFNTVLDGVFHAGTYALSIAGLVLLWRNANRPHPVRAGRLLVGSILMGFGFFNLIEGVINHQVLGLHHVNETVAREYWVYWDIGFLLWGALMVAIGMLLIRRPDS